MSVILCHIHISITPRRRFIQFPPMRWSFPEAREALTRQCATPDRHFGSRNCEEHPLQYLLRSSEPQQQQWGLADPQDSSRTLCYYHQNHHSPLHLKQQQQQLQQQQAEPHYETLEPLEGPPRPLFSSLAAVLNTMGPGIGSSSPCHVAYCGIQSPTDSTDQSSSSFMDTQMRCSPAASSPDNEMTDSLPNLDKRTGTGAKSIPASLTY